MFEDITRDSDDLIQTSFATSSDSGQKDFIKEPGKICKQVEKRQGFDLDYQKKSKTAKINIFTLSDVSKDNDCSPIKAVPRKFPGPAGLLPDNCDNENNSISDLFQNNKSHNSPEFFLCSQKNVSVFESGPWQQMITDFHDPKRELLFDIFNIFWIKEKFSGKKQLPNYKAPFLACSIENIELTDGKIPTIKLILKDKTGIIQGTILHSLYDEYSGYFTVGSVIVLIQFGVLSAHNSHCLTITPNNLLTIYHVDVKSTKDKRCTSSQSLIKKIVLQQYSIEGIWKKYNESVTYLQGKRCINLNNINPRFNSNHQNKFSATGVSNVKSCFGDNSLVNKLYSKNEQRDNTKLITESVTQNWVKSSAISSQSFLVATENISLSDCSSQTKSLTTDKAHSEIWKDLFQELDSDAFLDEF